MSGQRKHTNTLLPAHRTRIAHVLDGKKARLEALVGHRFKHVPVMEERRDLLVARPRENPVPLTGQHTRRGQHARGIQRHEGHELLRHQNDQQERHESANG